MKNRMKIVFLVIILFFNLNTIFSQSGTFDFVTATQSTDNVISETIDGVSLSFFSDYSKWSTYLHDWSAYPPITNNAASMNGQPKISCTFTFDQPVNIVSLLVVDSYSGRPHILFTANTGATYNGTIDADNGTYFSLNFEQITSFVVTNFDGGNIDLGFDQVTMDAALPVELTSFAATVSRSSVELQWETATEVNNYGFEIEIEYKESSSKNQEWQKIGFIEGHGNSNSPKYYSFTDATAISGNYAYRLKQIDIDGQFEYSDVVELSITAPIEFVLNSNYPNPFNPTTSISYSIPIDGHVTLDIYDVLGNKVATFVNGYKSAGSYTNSFDASELTSGFYFYTLRSGNFVETKKMLLMK